MTIPECLAALEEQAPRVPWILHPGRDGEVPRSRLRVEGLRASCPQPPWRSLPTRTSQKCMRLGACWASPQTISFGSCLPRAISQARIPRCASACDRPLDWREGDMRPTHYRSTHEGRTDAHG